LKKASGEVTVSKKYHSLAIDDVQEEIHDSLTQVTHDPELTLLVKACNSLFGSSFTEEIVKVGGRITVSF
jgi:hypothetical protein